MLVDLEGGYKIPEYQVLYFKVGISRLEIQNSLWISEMYVLTALLDEGTSTYISWFVQTLHEFTATSISLTDAQQSHKPNYNTIYTCNAKIKATNNASTNKQQPLE